MFNIYLFLLNKKVYKCRKTALLSRSIIVSINIFWFRRDLRLRDNTGLSQALSSGMKVLPVFIFDTNILSKLTLKDDARVTFIHQQLLLLQQELQLQGGNLRVYCGKPLEVFKNLLTEYPIESVYYNRDYEPYALERDAAINDLLEQHAVDFRGFKDQVIFEKSEITKSDGKPYTVFTPYMKKWKERLNEYGIPPEVQPAEINAGWHPNDGVVPSLAEIGFKDNQKITLPGNQINPGIIKQYPQNRDFPALQGTSRLGVHLRFGTISIRELVHHALNFQETFLNELIWREFYMMILWHFPKVVTQSFKRAYDHIPWRNDALEFEKWCEGKTGYPLVDAGMRQLNATGFMHNRVRMVTASFLTKHLLIDWRWGEAYFAERLLDFELASNNGGWQWAAGSGCDAAPYFRVFNPILQAKKFDPQGTYIKKWVPEWNTSQYPEPMVDHAFARKRALETYKTTLTAA